MRKKKHTVIILPSDFEGTKFESIFACPLAQAMKRHFKTDTACVGNVSTYIGDRERHFLIEVDERDLPQGFYEEDHFFAKAIKEPYPVVLTEC